MLASTGADLSGIALTSSSYASAIGDASTATYTIYDKRGQATETRKFRGHKFQIPGTLY